MNAFRSRPRTTSSVLAFGFSTGPDRRRDRRHLVAGPVLEHRRAGPDERLLQLLEHVLLLVLLDVVDVHVREERLHVALDAAVLARASRSTRRGAPS